MRSFGTTEPSGMKTEVGPLPVKGGAVAGMWWPAGWGGNPTPSQLGIDTWMKFAPPFGQLQVDVHELGHADHNPPRGTPRNVTEPRGVAYEQLFAPMLMRALGARVPPGFWANQREGAYRREFGDQAIEAQKDVLRRKFGAALYDREDSRNLPRFAPSPPPRRQPPPQAKRLLVGRK